jgi:NAD(P)H-hydrate epimerase
MGGLFLSCGITAIITRMHELPHQLYRAADVRALDRSAIDTYGIPGAALMARAGAAAFEVLRQRWPAARRIVVLCGTGNNGGDGFVLARLAHAAGYAVDVMQLGDAQRLVGDALAAAREMRDAGLRALRYSGQDLSAYDVIVDALLGTGLERVVEGEWFDAIEAVNAADTGVLALDLPSGLHADTGAVLGAAVRAAVTISFIGLKRGMFTAHGPDCCGVVRFHDLGVPAEVFTRVSPNCLRLSYATMAALLRPRPRAAHKGHHGHVLVIGGEEGMSGAARLAGEAALRAGAGLVTIATRRTHAALISAVRPELMAHPVEDVAALEPLLCRADIVAVGPGLGTGRWARTLMARVLETRLPLVVDADALNLIAAEPLRRDHWVLTPHPGEAGRLLGVATAAVQSDRFAAVAEVQRRYGGVAVLKGTGSLVIDPDGDVGLCDGGNPGMACGGMGDVLSGVIAALAAQGYDLPDAAALGVCLHAQAGDRAAALGGERGLLAGDLMVHLHHLANPLRR